MWKLGLDFGSSFSRPSTKTPPFQLLISTFSAWIFGGGAQDVGGRNSCNSKYVRRDQEDITRPVWRHKPHHSGPLRFSRKPTPGNICHARRDEHHLYWMSSTHPGASGFRGRFQRLRQVIGTQDTTCLSPRILPAVDRPCQATRHLRRKHFESDGVSQWRGRWGAHTAENTRRVHIYS